MCLTLSLLFLSPQLEKRGERRAEAEKLLAQAQELGTVNYFVIVFLHNSPEWQESGFIELFLCKLCGCIDLTTEIKINVFQWCKPIRTQVDILTIICFSYKSCIQIVEIEHFLFYVLKCKKKKPLCQPR